MRRASSNYDPICEEKRPQGETATTEPGLAILCNDTRGFLNLFLAFHEEMAENGESPLNVIHKLISK